MIFCRVDATTGNVPLNTVNGRLWSVDTAVIVGGSTVVGDEMVRREVLGTRGVGASEAGVCVLEVGSKV